MLQTIHAKLVGIFNNVKSDTALDLVNIQGNNTTCPPTHSTKIYSHISIISYNDTLSALTLEPLSLTIWTCTPWNPSTHKVYPFALQCYAALPSQKMTSALLLETYPINYKHLYIELKKINSILSYISCPFFPETIVKDPYPYKIQTLYHEEGYRHKLVD